MYVELFIANYFILFSLTTKIHLRKSQKTNNSQKKEEKINKYEKYLFSMSSSCWFGGNNHFTSFKFV
jgi:hypothetical protein